MKAKDVMICVTIAMGLVTLACRLEEQMWEPTLEPGWPVATQEGYTPVEPTPVETPWGSYIIVQVGATGQIGSQAVIASLVFNNTTVCSWNFGEDLPWDRQEEVLYFSPIEGNCPELDSRNGVVWYVTANYAEVKFEESGEWSVIQEIPVWVLIGVEYHLQPRQ